MSAIQALRDAGYSSLVDLFLDPASYDDRGRLQYAFLRHDVALGDRLRAIIYAAME